MAYPSVLNTQNPCVFYSVTYLDDSKLGRNPDAFMFERDERLWFGARDGTRPVPKVPLCI